MNLGDELILCVYHCETCNSNQYAYPELEYCPKCDAFYTDDEYKGEIIVEITDTLDEEEE